MTVLVDISRTFLQSLEFGGSGQQDSPKTLFQEILGNRGVCVCLRVAKSRNIPSWASNVQMNQ